MGSNHHEEHRRSARVREAIPVHFAVASENYKTEYQATTKDQSSRGLGIQIPVHLSPGDSIVVLSLGDSRISISGRVVWVQGARLPLAAVAGLELMSPIDELMAYLRLVKTSFPQNY
jgi:hypothetical protein